MRAIFIGGPPHCRLHSAKNLDSPYNQSREIRALSTRISGEHAGPRIGGIQAKNLDSPYNQRRENRRHAPSVYGRQRHHASAARGDGSDASVLDGTVWECLLDSYPRPGGAPGGGPRAGDAGASFSTAARPRWCSTPAAPRATTRPSSACCIRATISLPRRLSTRQCCGRRIAWPSAASKSRLLRRSRAGSSIPMDIERAMKPNTRLISMMLANNETGVLQPVEEIGKIAAAAGAFFHIDAVQGAGKVVFDVQALRLPPAVRSARTRCTGPRAWARCMCGAERRLSP